MSEATVTTTDLNMPSLRHLKAFEAVARHQSVGRASAEIRLSQPAVTQAIAKLESAVSARLMERSPTGSYLTEHGRTYLERVQRFFRQVEGALRELHVCDSAEEVAALMSRISRPQIRSLCTISEHKSLGIAAAKLDTSPAVTRRNALELERHLGRQLFRYAADGLVATEAGTLLARRMMVALREIELAHEEIRAALGVNAGRIVVGATTVEGSMIFALIANDLAERYPTACIEVMGGSYESLMELLAIGRIDFLFGLLRPAKVGSDVVAEELSTHRFVAVARRGHPLAARSSVARDDLAAFSWVLPTRGTPRRACFDQIFANCAKQPLVSVETNSRATTRAILASSDRLTLLSEYEMPFEPAPGPLIVLPYPATGPPHTIGIITRVGFKMTALHATFLDILRMRSGGRTKGPVATPEFASPAGSHKRAREKKTTKRDDGRSARRSASTARM